MARVEPKERVDTALLKDIPLDSDTRDVLLDILELNKRSPKAKAVIKGIEGILGRFPYLYPYFDEGPRPSHIKAEIKEIRVHTQALCACLESLTEAATNRISWGKYVRQMAPT